jgi:SAM-dependent MidA family methyltransferase
VDFSSVAEAAELAGFAVAGFTTQAAFLLGAGIDRELSAESAAHEVSTPQGDSLKVDPRHVELTRGVRRLLLPGEMGEAVKFMLLTRGIAADFFDEEPAFSLQDLRASL